MTHAVGRSDRKAYRPPPVESSGACLLCPEPPRSSFSLGSPWFLLPVLLLCSLLRFPLPRSDSAAPSGLRGQQVCNAGTRIVHVTRHSIFLSTLRSLQDWTAPSRDGQVRCLERTCSLVVVRPPGSENSCGKHRRVRRDTVIQAWSVAPPRGRPSPRIKTKTTTQNLEALPNRLGG